MTIEVTRVGDRYTAVVSPPHGELRSLKLMTCAELVSTLEAMGCHRTDIGDAMDAADPDWLERGCDDQDSIGFHRRTVVASGGRAAGGSMLDRLRSLVAGQRGRVDVVEGGPKAQADIFLRDAVLVYCIQSQGLLPPHARAIAISTDEPTRRITVHFALSRYDPVDEESIWTVIDEMLDLYEGDGPSVTIEPDVWVGKDPAAAPWWRHHAEVIGVYRVRPDRLSPLGDDAGMPTVLHAARGALDRTLSGITPPGAVTIRVLVAEADQAGAVMGIVGLALGYEPARAGQHVMAELFPAGGSEPLPAGDVVVLVVDGLADLTRRSPGEALDAVLALGELSRRCAVAGDSLRIVLVEFP